MTTATKVTGATGYLIPFARKVSEGEQKVYPTNDAHVVPVRNAKIPPQKVK